MNSERDVVAPWLAGRRAEVLGAWRRLLFERLAPEAVPHLQNPDPFANPFGHRIHTVTEAVLEGLASGAPCESLAADLEPLIRLQALQGGRASRAVAFVPLLQEAARRVPGGIPETEAEALRGRLHALLLVAFDVYSRCRDDLFEIRVREAQRRVAVLLDRAGAAHASPEHGESEGRTPR